MFLKWDEIPDFMRTDAVQPYYEILYKKRYLLTWKRLFDITASSILLIVLSPLLLFIAILISIDSKGGIFFLQERVSLYGKKFRIHKFRTMISNAETIGSKVTARNDFRITKIGSKLRHVRLDELPQLFDILVGNMSFCGTRPEVSKFVEQYTDEMNATLLLRPGVTSEASILFKDEEKYLVDASDIDERYVKKILPLKMKYNLEYTKKVSLLIDIRIMLKTLWFVL